MGFGVAPSTNHQPAALSHSVSIPIRLLPLHSTSGAFTEQLVRVRVYEAMYLRGNGQDLKSERQLIAVNGANRGPQQIDFEADPEPVR